MIKVTSAGAASADRIKRKKTTSTDSDDGGFSDLLSLSSTQTPTIAPPTGNAPVSDVNSLLSMQEVSDEEHQRRQEIRHAGTTLEELEKLRDAMLCGSVPVSLLKRMETLVAKERGRITDPALKEILDHIELRAAVELAKLER